MKSLVNLHNSWLNWRTIVKRKSSKESLTDSYDIMNSVFEWLNIIEMKNFVDDGMFLSMKITLFICQNQNICTTRTNEDFIQISKDLTPYHWEMVLISSKRCLFWNDCKEKHEKNNMCLLTSTSINNGSRHWVRLLRDGNDKALGGFPIMSNVKKEMHQVLSEWTTRCLQYLTSFETDFCEFNSFFYRLTIHSWRRSTVIDGRGGCLDNTSNDPFSRCESVQQFDYRWDWRSQKTVRLQVHNWTTISRKKELYIHCCTCVTKPSDKTHDTNDNVTTKTTSTFHTAHMNLNTWIDARVIPRAHGPAVRFRSLWFNITSWMKFMLCASLMSSMHVVCVTLRLWALHSIQLPLLLSHQFLAVLFCFFPQPWGQ